MCILGKEKKHKKQHFEKYKIRNLNFIHWFIFL